MPLGNKFSQKNHRKNIYLRKEHMKWRYTKLEKIASSAHRLPLTSIKLLSANPIPCFKAYL